jgi:hypothetical protein
MYDPAACALRVAAYYLPDWVPGSTYVRLAGELGLQDVRTTDWSEHVVSRARRTARQQAVF